MPRKPINMKNKEQLLARLKLKTVIDPDTNCWLWKGSLSQVTHGYGQIRLGYALYFVHRLSAYIFHDYDIGSVLQVNHKNTCKNKNCWNPEHVYVGTQRENLIEYWEDKEVRPDSVIRRHRVRRRQVSND
jgi:hypothetical protein